MTPEKKDWKMINESYTSLLWFYDGVKTGYLMSWFLGVNGVFINLNMNFYNLAVKVL